MDPTLLKERELFKKRALAQPAVESKVKKHKVDDRVKHKKKSKPPEPKANNVFDYKSHQGGSQYKFSVLRKIVNFMKSRHQVGDSHPLILEEILDESNQLDVTGKIKHWLKTEALRNNPKIEIIEEDKFVYKPKYNIKDRKSLLRLLQRHDQQGLGGILYEDVEESLPHATKQVEKLKDSIVTIICPQSKKKVLYFNDKSYEYTVDEELIKLWRSVAVDGVDEAKVEEYLEKQGISSMQDVGIRKVVPLHKRRKGGKKNKTFKKLNDHLSDVLQDYTEK